MCDGLSMLKRNIGKTASDGSGVTALIDNVDYLSGKWVDKESLTQLYACFPSNSTIEVSIILKSHRPKTAFVSVLQAHRQQSYKAVHLL